MFIIKLEGKAQLLTKEDQKVTIYLGWTHQFQFAGYYAALEKGYFKDAGLEVELIQTTGQDKVEAILNGTYNYAVGTAGTLLENEGYKKLTVLAAIFQQSPVSLIALKSRGINNLRDINSADITGSTEIKAMLISAGVDMSTVSVHGDSGKFSELISGRFDAISYFVTDQAKLLGNDSVLFNIFRPLEYGINFYGECFFTSRGEVETNPERALKMYEAVIQGWQYAVLHPEEMINIIHDKYNASLSKEELSREADITIHKLILPKFYDIGDVQKSKWEQMATLLYDFSIIEEPINLDGFLYSSPSEDSENLKLLLRITSVIISFTAIFLLLLLIYSRQLKRAVKARTASLQKANNEMDRFVYSISHDIRSPLSSVQGLINIIKIDDSDYKKYLKLIESSIQKLDSYTKDILDYTRNSRAKLKVKEVDINEVIDKCIGQVKYANNSTKLDFRSIIEIDKPIVTDSWRLEVILTNILSNSVKYRDVEKENPFVDIRALTGENGVIISITDNGIGIDKQHMHKIYDMFYRASEDSQGSGLGLYIVHETIHMLKGSIEISSAVSEGTTIKIELPNLKD